ncbi:hypothetical protein BDQ12DRAFT_691274 [Crucibulum laeve]|uniref:Mug135-like C-terminal domain-containing protein n=1 Tax=Crucibulum laeve TaxID=68775 RepID=A0A5C3LX32_9AGAR|nr:hypothetical protein BDQ12DRAFT_691274 [Crucibulum laeve]
MPIPLPLAIQDGIVTGDARIANPPADPPTPADVVNAIRYEKFVVDGFADPGNDNTITEDHVASALEYKASVITARNPAAVAPPWLAHVLDQINRRFDVLDGRFDQVDARFDEVDGQLDQIKATVQEVNHTSSYLFNRTVLNGAFTSFKEIPFPDGTWPTKEPNNLPLIESVTTLQAMTDREIQTYHSKYCTDQPRARRTIRIEDS